MTAGAAWDWLGWMGWLHQSWQHDASLPVLAVGFGLLLIFLEFNRPGRVVPGCLGALLMLGGVFRLSLLSLRPMAVVCAGAGLALVLAELRFARRGWLAMPGGLLLGAGLLRLVAASPAGPVGSGVAWPVALGVAAVLAAVASMLGHVAGLARRNKFTVGMAALRGKRALAKEPPRPGRSGHGARVDIAGELWPARLAVGSDPVAAGAALLVVAVEGRTLLVRPLDGVGISLARPPQSLATE